MADIEPTTEELEAVMPPHMHRIIREGADDRRAAIMASREAERLKREAPRALRLERNARLAASDYTQLLDFPKAKQAAWAVYRQALRDLPQNTVDFLNPVWPVEPA